MNDNIEHVIKTNKAFLSKLESGKSVSEIFDESIEKAKLPDISFKELQTFRKSYYDENTIDTAALEESEALDRKKHLANLSKLVLNGSRK